MTRIAGLLGVLLVGCTSHERAAPEAPPPSPRATLARDMGVELPPNGGVDPLVAEPSVWIGPSEVALMRADGTVVRGLATLKNGEVDGKPDHIMFDELYDAVMPDVPEPERNGPSDANLFVDRRVSAGALVVAMYTLGRAGVTRFHLVGGTPDAPRALLIEMPYVGERQPDRPVSELRSDLALTWEADGMRAWALPRSASRRPFADGRDEPPPVDGDDPSPPPDPPHLVDRVPLSLAKDHDDPLDPASTSRLSAALCEFNKREPFGVLLEPSWTATYGDLLSLAVAAIPPADCRGPKRLFMYETRRRTGPALTLDELPARLLPARG
ncbi:MAG: hypothetical protein JNL82_06945 [Myxococcales bacterium]|nr:hypothetical protein [Myxococcales bacterium]